MTTAQPSDTVINDRRHDLDALRAFAMLLGIGLHASLSFFTAPWPVQDSQQNGLLGLFFMIVHGFRMPLFFIVSGYFTMLLFRRRGLLALVKQRAARILLPCLLGLITIVPLTKFVSGLALTSPSAATAIDSSTLVGAIRAKDSQRIDTLLQDAKDINQLDPQFGVSPLNWAVLNGDLDLTQQLIEHGADVTLANRDGNTPLHAAAFLGNVAVFELLLEHKADVTAKNQAGDPPLKATEADWETTQYILGLLKAPLPERAQVEEGRKKIRDRIAQLTVTSTTSAAEKPARSSSQTALRDRYQQWLRSDAWTVSVAGTKWSLFYTDVFSHLWFLWFLCWMVAGFSLVTSTIGPRLGVLPIPGTSWLLMALTLVPQWVTGNGAFHFGPDTSTGWLPQPHLLVYYGLFFAYGVLHFEAQARGQQTARRYWLPLTIGLVVAFPAWLMSIGNFAVGAVAQVVYVWSMCLGLLGLFRRYLPKESAWLRYISDSSYWLYLAHLPLVMELQREVRDWPVSPMLKFLGINIVAVSLLLLSYQLLVRRTWIGVLLNGKRQISKSASKSASGSASPSTATGN